MFDEEHLDDHHECQREIAKVEQERDEARAECERLRGQRNDAESWASNKEDWITRAERAEAECERLREAFRRFLQDEANSNWGSPKEHPTNVIDVLRNKWSDRAAAKVEP